MEVHYNGTESEEKVKDDTEKRFFNQLKMSSPLLKGTLVCEAPYVTIGTFDIIRIYYKGVEGENLEVVVVEVDSWGVDYDCAWADPGMTCSVILRGSGAFDGMRHLWIGEDGYLYYANMDAMSDIFLAFRKLEKQFKLDYEKGY